jgi:ferredoxin-nitrite reductase
MKDGCGVEPGIWFRLAIGGITGHKDFARETGVIVKPAEATLVADAVVRVFIDHGDRTNRTKARLKYVLDAFGIEKFLGLMEEKLGRKLVHIANEAIAPRPAFDRFGHIGVHPQKQAGLNWIGVVLPVGKMTAAQMRGLAAVARDFGDGDIRLTVWQNFLISGVPTERVAAAESAIEALGLTTKANSIRSGLVACTGNVGCKFAASIPSAMRRRSPRGARPGSRSTRPSTSISPAAIIPARSISSAKSGSWRARCRRPRTARRSRAITSWSAAASGPMPRWAATSTRT